MSGISQTNIILNELLAGKKVSQLEVTYKFNITRLGAKIFNLRAKGYDVQDMWEYPLVGAKYKLYYLNNNEIKRIKKLLSKSK